MNDAEQLRRTNVLLEAALMLSPADRRCADALGLLRSIGLGAAALASSLVAHREPGDSSIRPAR